MFYDLIIIGGGPAGITASIYAKRFGLDVLLIEKLSIGGQVILTDLIENYPGFPEGIKGPDLILKMEEQAKKFDAEFLIDEVTNVEIEGEIKKVKTNSNEFSSYGLIIATGTNPKKLDVPGEKEFTGKGVSYCAICDAFFYRNKIVLVIGGGDSALSEAIYLSNFANKVYIVHRRDKFRAAQYLQDKILKNEKIEVIYNSVVKKIYGDKRVEGAIVENIKENKEIDIKVNGIFIYVGLIPNSELFKGKLNLDENGFIITDEEMRTNINYVYAVGDVRRKSLRQIVTACADGAIAVNSFCMDKKDKC